MAVPSHAVKQSVAQPSGPAHAEPSDGLQPLFLSGANISNNVTVLSSER
jgi:hypothetical protein